MHACSVRIELHVTESVGHGRPRVTPHLSLGLSQGYLTHISRVVLPDRPMSPTPNTSLHLALSIDHTDTYERTV